MAEGTISCLAGVTLPCARLCRRGRSLPTFSVSISLFPQSRGIGTRLQVATLKVSSQKQKLKVELEQKESRAKEEQQNCGS